MTIAPEMKELTRNIASSRQDRMKRIGEIREEVKGTRIETQDMIHSFEDSRQETSRQLRKDLARDKAGMGAEVRAMRNGFQSSHKELSSALKKDLSEHAQGVRGEVARLRQEIGASHQNMSAKLKKNLARGAAALKSEAHAMLNGFQRSHKQMGVQLRKELAAYDRGIESEVSGMRQETMADLQEARAAWQGLASAMPADRGGVKTPLKAKTPAAKEETPDLETKLLTAIGEYPAGGMTLADLANTLGVAPVVLGKASRNLLEKGKIRKKNKLYFPADGEKEADTRFRFRQPLRSRRGNS